MIFKQHLTDFKEGSFASGSKNESCPVTYWLGGGAQFICAPGPLFISSVKWEQHSLPAQVLCGLSKRMTMGEVGPVSRIHVVARKHSVTSASPSPILRSSHKNSIV